MQEHQSMCYEKLHSAIDTRFDTLQSIIGSLADNVASLLVFSTPTTNLDNPPSANGVPHASPIFDIGPNGPSQNSTHYSKAHSHHHNALCFSPNN